MIAEVEVEVVVRVEVEVALTGHRTFQKHVSLIGDEMYIKEGLVYNKHNGELIGYRDLGDINNHLLQLEKEYQNQNHVQSHQFASTMMVVMVRGLFTSFIFPYATSNLTGEQLVPIFYEAIMHVELCGLKVTVCYGKGSFHQFYISQCNLQLDW